ncbi:MAG: CinA family protein [Rickettsiaceae bacterium]|nr:CinA family protein [Rickettsiaceae bacterium]
MLNKELLNLVQQIKEAKSAIIISTAESCTGGMLAAYLTELAGASHYFATGIISYSNAAKIKFLSVQKQTLDKFGAVSEEVAREMAEGCRKVSESDLALAITGIAGPGGGTVHKPVGMVCFGVSTPSGTKTSTHYFKGNRADVRQQACLIALQLILSEIV